MLWCGWHDCYLKDEKHSYLSTHIQFALGLPSKNNTAPILREAGGSQQQQIWLASVENRQGRMKGKIKFLAQKLLNSGGWIELAS